jgi:hypothetical protein
VLDELHSMTPSMVVCQVSICGGRSRPQRRTGSAPLSPDGRLVEPVSQQDEPEACPDHVRSMSSQLVGSRSDIARASRSAWSRFEVSCGPLVQATARRLLRRRGSAFPCPAGCPDRDARPGSRLGHGGRAWRRRLLRCPRPSRRSTMRTASRRLAPLGRDVTACASLHSSRIVAANRHIPSHPKCSGRQITNPDLRSQWRPARPTSPGESPRSLSPPHRPSHGILVHAEPSFAPAVGPDTLALARRMAQVD